MNTIQYSSSKWRLPDRIFKRDYNLESNYGIYDIKLYGYTGSSLSSLRIVGEIFAQEPLTRDFCMICTLLDKDGDIIETEESNSYGGSGLVTSMIKPASFFNGYPCVFSFYGIPMEQLKEICIVPASDY